MLGGGCSEHGGRQGVYRATPILTLAMSRRNLGLSSLSSRTALSSDYSALSSALTAQSVAGLSATLESFSAQLGQFSAKHHARIRGSGEMRDQFSALCRELGVDPLAGFGKGGVWSLFGLGDYYHALALLIVDVCLAARDSMGGYLALDYVQRTVSALKPTPVTMNDILQAIHALAPLEQGYAVVTVQGVKLLKCSTAQLNSDSTTLLDAVASTELGHLSSTELQAYTRTLGSEWSQERVQRCLEVAVLQEGIVWTDEQAEGGTQYWVPALFTFD